MFPTEKEFLWWDESEGLFFELLWIKFSRGQNSATCKYILYKNGLYTKCLQTTQALSYQNQFDPYVNFSHVISI